MIAKFNGGYEPFHIIPDSLVINIQFRLKTWYNCRLIVITCSGSQGTTA